MFKGQLTLCPLIAQVNTRFSAPWFTHQEMWKLKQSDEVDHSHVCGCELNSEGLTQTSQPVRDGVSGPTGVLGERWQPLSIAENQFSNGEAQ